MAKHPECTSSSGKVRTWPVFVLFTCNQRGDLRHFGDFPPPMKKNSGNREPWGSAADCYFDLLPALFIGGFSPYLSLQFRSLGPCRTASVCQITRISSTNWRLPSPRRPPQPRAVVAEEVLPHWEPHRHPSKRQTIR